MAFEGNTISVEFKIYGQTVFTFVQPDIRRLKVLSGAGAHPICYYDDGHSQKTPLQITGCRKRKHGHIALHRPGVLVDGDIRHRSGGWAEEQNMSDSNHNITTELGKGIDLKGKIT